MMSNSDPETFSFRVRVSQRNGNLSPESRVTVLDAYDRPRAEGDGELDAQLARGLYTVTVERLGDAVETVVRHTGVTTLGLKEPQRASAVPSMDTVATHEDFAFTSKALSVGETAPPLTPHGPANGRIFIFLRTLGEQHDQGEDLADNLEILDGHGAPLVQFDGSNTQRDTIGWQCFSARASEGLYVLSYSGESPREMPIYVFRGWSTQLFASYRKSLRLETAALLISDEDEGFDPESRATQAMDAAFKGLMQGRNFLPKPMMQRLLDDKFQNPMLGLLGAHLLFLRDTPPSPRLLGNVLGNLESLLGSCPDVRALGLLAAEALGQTPEHEPFPDPPMVRAGLDAVLRHAARFPDLDLVPEGSLLDRLATQQLADSPWSAWEPVLTGAERTPEEDWVAAFVASAVERARITGDHLDARRLAQSVALPTRTVEGHLAGYADRVVEKVPSRELLKLDGVGQKIGGLLTSMGYDSLEEVAGLLTSDVEKVRQRLGRFARSSDPVAWVTQAQSLISKE